MGIINILRGREKPLVIPRGTEFKPRKTSGVVKFFKGKDGQMYFHVRALNGNVLASSEGYTRRAFAERGVLALKKALVSPRVEY